MNITESSVLLRIYVSESDHWKSMPLYEAIVLEARDRHLAGATVLRGPMGFGQHSRLHTARLLRLSENLPVVIEIVDEADKVNTFLQDISELIHDALVTLENVQVIRYRAESGPD